MPTGAQLSIAAEQAAGQWTHRPTLDDEDSRTTPYATGKSVASSRGTVGGRERGGLDQAYEGGRRLAPPVIVLVSDPSTRALRELACAGAWTALDHPAPMARIAAVGRMAAEASSAAV